MRLLQAGIRLWLRLVGGGGGIRTPEAHHLTVFKTAAFNRSATPPTRRTKVYQARGHGSEVRFELSPQSLNRESVPKRTPSQPSPLRQGGAGSGNWRLAACCRSEGYPEL